jgi:hypothetical protein
MINLRKLALWLVEHLHVVAVHDRIHQDLRSGQLRLTYNSVSFTNFETKFSGDILEMLN